ncbi:hypothetical protein JMA_43370 (plasmid) [Jeotgalibacillus malaysiensis]|uniref:Uncharacterized protein n=1 Tax=Jeotgalibacillus malaysiensis TaxID=1508404 RepID=A0A0B5B0F3_9BACL|nr:hypothetical protein [Jeotgalibacillus malaysiensis]AJD93654.1 hypothetical protein JMA_43370 [Jeotgalibacillus malaysiensis]
MKKQPGFVVLQAENGFVRITHDTNTGTFRMGFKSGDNIQWKFISESLYQQMAKELAHQPGKSS